MDDDLHSTFLWLWPQEGGILFQVSTIIDADIAAMIISTGEQVGWILTSGLWILTSAIQTPAPLIFLVGQTSARKRQQR